MFRLYNKQKQLERNGERYEKDTLDLDKWVVKKIFELANGEGIPCLVDGSIMYTRNADTGSLEVRSDLKETQIFRLAALLSQKSLSDWEGYATNFDALQITTLLAGLQKDIM